MKTKITKTDFLAGMLVGSCIIGMVFCFIFTLADVASKPAAHSAAYAVLNPSYLRLSNNPDQGCATSVSLSGQVPGLLNDDDHNEY